MRSLKSAVVLLSTVSLHAIEAGEIPDAALGPVQREAKRLLSKNAAKKLSYRAIRLEPKSKKSKSRGKGGSYPSKGKGSQDDNSIGCASSHKSGNGKGSIKNTSGKGSSDGSGNGGSKGRNRTSPPTMNPTVSAKPSHTPTTSIQPSFSPSCSHSPTASESPSFAPTFSAKPSSKPTYTSKPSKSPTASPTKVPTMSPVFGTNSPTLNPSQIPSIEPTGFPSIGFDLQNCDSYSRVWLFDLESTCDPYYRTCQCTDAQRLINEGKIDCETASCPDDCALCDFCLQDVIPNCISKSERGVFSDPSLPVEQELDTFSLNASQEAVAYDNFNIKKCETYELAWLEDLENSCEQGSYGETKNCSCDRAQSLINDGKIECGKSKCPDDCEVCKYCLNEVIHCL